MYTYNMAEPFDYESVAGLALWRLWKVWQGRRRAALRELGLGHTEFVILANLAWMQSRTDPLTQQAVADALGIDKMTASHAVRSLRRKGLVEAIPYPRDHRAVQLRVTPGGLSLARRGAREVTELSEKFFGVLGSDQDRFTELANRLIHANAAKENR
jgi:MarR family transcriptional regulator, organic hydroperoxide resistance regulator